MHRARTRTVLGVGHQISTRHSFVNSFLSQRLEKKDSSNRRLHMCLFYTSVNLFCLF